MRLLPRKCWVRTKRGHLVGEKLEEALGIAHVQALWELYPGVLVEGAPDQVHVDAVEAAAIAKQRVVNFRPSAQFFKRHRSLFMLLRTLPHP